MAGAFIQRKGKEYYPIKIYFSDLNEREYRQGEFAGTAYRVNTGNGGCNQRGSGDPGTSGFDSGFFGCLIGTGNR